MIHVELRQKNSDRNELLNVTFTEFHDLQRLPAVDEVFLMDNRMQALTGDALPVSVTAGYYSSNLFTYMGVPPLLGREFTPSRRSRRQRQPGRRAQLPLLEEAIRRQARHHRQDHRTRPYALHGDRRRLAALYVGRFRRLHARQLQGRSPLLHDAFLKLKPGVIIRANRRRVAAAGRQLCKAGPTNFPQNAKVEIKTLNEEVMRGFEAPLLMLFAAVLLLLLIGCANVSILMLARERRASMSSQCARRLARAGRASCGNCSPRPVCSRCSARPSAFCSRTRELICWPRPAPVFLSARGVDPRERTVLLFAVAIALLTGISSAVRPHGTLAPRGWRADAGFSAKLAGTVRGRHTHRLLIAGQVALTMLLLASAGAALRAFATLYHTPLGFILTTSFMSLCRSQRWSTPGKRSPPRRNPIARLPRPRRE